MQEGAFALIDCLGFKGIWKNEDADLVLEKLSKVESIIQNKLSGFENLSVDISDKKIVVAEYLKPKVILLSDTVAISLPYHYEAKQEEADYLKGMTIYLICTIVSAIVQFFVDDPIPLPMRGYVTFGNYSMENNFIIGPAVDEAAGHYEIADGAFVWLPPKVSKLLEIFSSKNDQMYNLIAEKAKSVTPAAEETNLLKLLLNMYTIYRTAPIIIKNYNMPLKNGVNLECTVVNPLFTLKNDEERQKTIESYINSFNRNDDVAVLIKKQNTLKFINEANAQCLEFDDLNIDFESLRNKLNLPSSSSKT